MLRNISIADEYTDGINEELRDFLRSVSSQSSFEDLIWFLDKLKRSEGHGNGDYTVYFASTPKPYLELVRYWALFRIRNNYAVHTVATNVTCLKRFLEFLVTDCSMLPMAKVTRLTIEAFEEHLEDVRSVGRSSKEAIWTALSGFFKDMHSWPEMPDAAVVPYGNPFSRRELDRKHGERLIPEEILAVLDNVFRDKRLPLEDRLMYWILRSIPSRVQEITSMDLECLRPYRDGFILALDDWKQSGNQHRSQKRLIHLLDKGHGKFLLDLVREQQEFARAFQDNLSKEKRGYLFISHPFIHLNSHLKGIAKPRQNTLPTVLNGPRVRQRFKRIAVAFDVRDAQGKIFNVITHAFRHNGITERLYEGFSYIEIRDMTGHANDQMINTSYTHTKDEEIKAVAKKKREKGEQGPPVLFKGRIMNLTHEREAKILKNPRAYRIGELGICSDITSCKGDLFECLACKLLAPDADNEEYYIAEQEKWSERAAKHLKNGKKTLAEQAHHMADLHQKQLDRIKLGLIMALPEESACGD